MHIVFVTEVGETYSVDIDPQMEVENIMALLEAEVRVSIPTFFTLNSIGHAVWHSRPGAELVL
jgi:hypothetical protein